MGGRKGTGEERNRELTLIFSATVSEQCLLRGKRVPQPPPTHPPVPSIHSRGRQSSFPAAAGKGGKGRQGAPAAAAARLCTGGHDNARGPRRPFARRAAGRRRAPRTRTLRNAGERPALLTCFPSILQKAGERRSGCLKRSSCKETSTALALPPAGGSPPPGKGQPRLEKYRYCYERRLPGSFLQLPLPGRGAAELGPRR